MYLWPFYLYLVCLVGVVRAQHQTFSWSIPNELQECGAAQITLAPFSKTSSFNGVGPFYMISYELGGIATTDFLGTNWQNLTWTVRHPQGAQIFLNVVDSTENSGGILSGVVQVGATNSCLPLKPTSTMKVTANLPQVATCDSVSSTISGGNKPYTISIVSTANYNSPANFTIGDNDDIFTYVNKVPPGDSFFITASDSSGLWAYGTNFISSIGSTDVSCPGQQSFGSQSTNATRTDDMTTTFSASSDTHSLHLSGAAIGGLIAGGVTLLLSAGFFVCCLLRRRRYISTTSRKILPFSGAITPFITQPYPSPMARLQQSSIHTRYSKVSPFDYSEVPLLRNPHPPSRTPEPVVATAIHSHSGSIFGGDPDPFFAAYPETRRVSQSSSSSGAIMASSNHGDSSSLYQLDRPLRLVTSHMPIERTMKENIAYQASRERGSRLPVIQHEDAEDLLEIPPMYRARGESI